MLADCLYHGMQNQVPPTVNLHTPIEVDKSVMQLVNATTASASPLRAVLSNSFGFGGTNASLLFAAV